MAATLVLVLDMAQVLNTAQVLDMGLGLDMEQEQGGMDMCEDMVHAMVQDMDSDVDMVQDMEQDMVLDGQLDRTRRCLHSSLPYSIWYGHLGSRSDSKHSR